MARHWKEQLDPAKHRDFMRGHQDTGGLPAVAKGGGLLEEWVYFVEVVGFRFQFTSTDQIREALEYFEQKVHPSTREFNNGLEHYWQPWYSRLPAGLKSKSKRGRVLKALKAALAQYEAEA